MHKLRALRSPRFGLEETGHLRDLDFEQFAEDRPDVDAGKKIARAPGSLGGAGVIADVRIVEREIHERGHGQRAAFADLSSSSHSVYSCDRDKQLTQLAAPEQQLREPARRNLLQLASGFRRARHGFAIDRQDDVARAYAGGRGAAVGIDIGDHRARLPGRDLQPARDVGGQILQRQPEARAMIFRRVGTRVVAARRPVLFCIEVQFVDGDRQGPLLLVAQHLDRHLRARLRADHHLDEVVRFRDRMAVELHDDIARLDAALFRGAAARDGRHDGPGRRFQAEVRECFARTGVTDTPMRPATTFP